MDQVKFLEWEGVWVRLAPHNMLPPEDVKDCPVVQMTVGRPGFYRKAEPGERSFPALNVSGIYK